MNVYEKSTNKNLAVKKITIDDLVSIIPQEI